MLSSNDSRINSVIVHKSYFMFSSLLVTTLSGGFSSVNRSDFDDYSLNKGENIFLNPDMKSLFIFT